MIKKVLFGVAAILAGLVALGVADSGISRDPVADLRAQCMVNLGADRATGDRYEAFRQRCTRDAERTLAWGAQVR